MRCGANVPAVTALFFGLKAAVLVIVVEALLRIGKRALKTRMLMGIAAVSFIAIFFLGVPFPLIVVAAATAGFIGNVVATETLAVASGPSPVRASLGVTDSLFGDKVLEHTRPRMRYAWRSLRVAVTLAVPVAVVVASLGNPERF